jgi:hypothetical protein
MRRRLIPIIARPATLLVAVGLLLQAWVPFASSAQPRLADPVLAIAAFCGGSPSHGSDKAPAHHHDGCTLCQPASLGAFLLPAQPPAVLRIALAGAPARWQLLADQRAAPPSPYASRAPPRIG